MWVCTELGALGHAGRAVLSRCPNPGVVSREATWDFQYGPGRPVYEQRLHESAQARGHSDQYGWTRASVRQRLCGAPLANRQVRGGVLKGLYNRTRSSAGPWGVLYVLQPWAVASSARLSDASSSVSLKGGIQGVRLNLWEANFGLDNGVHLKRSRFSPND